MSDGDVVFVDTETLGLDPAAPVWEFAAIRRNAADGAHFTSHFTIEHLAGRWLREMPEWLVEDYLARYKPEAAWCEAAAASQIAAFTAGAHWVGCNPGYDTERLTRLLERHGHVPRWHYHPTDIASMAEGYLRGRGEPLPNPCKSNSLSLALGVDPALYARHTALGDVQWVRDQYDTMSAPNPTNIAAELEADAKIARELVNSLGELVGQLGREAG